MLQETFAELVDAVVDACRSVYAGRLKAVAVYGSVARRRMSHDSDIDLLVVVEPLRSGRLDRMDEFASVERLVEPALETARKRGVTTWLSPIIRTFAELDQTGFLLFDIACDAVVSYDPSGDLSRYLASVRQGLERRGAQRRTLRGSLYWVLKPDVRPGEVVEL